MHFTSTMQKGGAVCERKNGTSAIRQWFSNVSVGTFISVLRS